MVVMIDNSKTPFSLESYHWSQVYYKNDMGKCYKATMTKCNWKCNSLLYIFLETLTSYFIVRIFAIYHWNLNICSKSVLEATRKCSPVCSRPSSIELHHQAKSTYLQFMPITFEPIMQRDRMYHWSLHHHSFYLNNQTMFLDTDAAFPFFNCST